MAWALEQMLAMRSYMRAKSVEGRIDPWIPERVGLTQPMIEEMYKVMAQANYEDRYVIPTAHCELEEEAYVLRGSTGFGLHEGTGGRTKTNLFGGAKRTLKKAYMNVPI